MNYLAHLHLAWRAGLDPAGAILPDLPDRPRSTRPDDLPESLAAGWRHHHRIDAQADADPAHGRIRATLAPAAGVFAGVAADILCDHLLATGWARWESTPFPAFAALCQASMERTACLVPWCAPLFARVRHAAVLDSFQTLAGIQGAFARLQRRTPRIVPVTAILTILQENRSRLEEDFALLYARLGH